MKALTGVLLLITGITTAGADLRMLQRDEIRVEDGDTLLLRIDDRPVRIQIIGIDAPEDTDNPKLRVDSKRTGLPPERLKPIGEIATLMLRFLVDTQAPFRLDYHPDQVDRYGRIPGDLTGQGQAQSLSRQMLNDGYAITLKRGLDKALAAELAAIEHKARSRGRGLWGLYPEVAARWAGGPAAISR